MATNNFPFHGIFSALSSEVQQEVPPAETTAHVVARETQQPVKPGQMAVDIYEQDGYYIIKAPIAGVRLSDIDIEVHDNIVTIRGTRNQTDDIANEQYFLQECFWGEFERKVTLPFSVDAKKIKATFNKECILKLVIPKEDQQRVKVVRINEG